MVGPTKLTSTIKDPPPRDFLAVLFSSPGEDSSSSCIVCILYYSSWDLSAMPNRLQLQILNSAPMARI